MSDLILYHALLSTCSQKVRYALAWKRLPYVDHFISLRAGEHLSDWYLAINPNGVVPALQHGAATIVDSSVICEYLDDAFAERPLTPAEPVAKAQMRAWMRYFEEVPTVAIRAPSFNQFFVKEIAARGEEANAAQRERMPLRKHFYAKLGNGFGDDVIAESRERLASCLQRVERAVGGSGPFLLGDALTIADVVLLPSVVRMEDLGMAAMWQDLPGVQRWYAAMQAAPAFDAAYAPGARFGRPA